MDPYKLGLALVGIALIGATWLPRLLKRNPLTFPIVFVLIGIGIYLLPLPLPTPDPLRSLVTVERLTELVVLVALLGAGLRIDTRFGWRRWATTWRMLAIAMPLTIAGCAVLGYFVLGLTAASALLLGAVLAPTDPVLASDVQVGGPGEGDEDPVRLTLSSEAGLNDGLAFPFVWLAIAVAASGVAAESGWLLEWTLLDLLWRIAAGVAIGALAGYGLMHLIFRTRSDDELARSSDGLAALAITLFVYGVAELCQGYGFLAVFVAAVVLRHHEREHDYHRTLHRFADQCERLLTALLLILLGGSIAGGVLAALQPLDWVVALAIMTIVRPLSGRIALMGSTLSTPERWAVSVFGIRGMGSFFYLAFALNHARFDAASRLWAIVTLVVGLSILLHGLTASPVLARIDRWRKRGPARRAIE